MSLNVMKWWWFENMCMDAAESYMSTSVSLQGLVSHFFWPVKMAAKAQLSLSAAIFAALSFSPSFFLSFWQQSAFTCPCFLHFQHSMSVLDLSCHSSIFSLSNSSNRLYLAQVQLLQVSQTVISCWWVTGKSSRGSENYGNELIVWQDCFNSWKLFLHSHQCF